MAKISTIPSGLVVPDDLQKLVDHLDEHFGGVDALMASSTEATLFVRAQKTREAVAMVELVKHRATAIWFATKLITPIPFWDQLRKAGVGVMGFDRHADV
jgi:hypothetical protein